MRTLGRGLARTRSLKLARMCWATSLRSRLEALPSRDRGVGACAGDWYLGAASGVLQHTYNAVQSMLRLSPTVPLAPPHQSAVPVNGVESMNEKASYRGRYFTLLDEFRCRQGQMVVLPLCRLRRAGVREPQNA